MDVVSTEPQHDVFDIDLEFILQSPFFRSVPGTNVAWRDFVSILHTSRSCWVNPTVVAHGYDTIFFESQPAQRMVIYLLRLFQRLADFVLVTRERMIDPP